MKKKYVEPVILVEDFSLSEMVAAKCSYTYENLLASQMSGSYPVCGTPNKYPESDPRYDHYQIINDAYRGDFDVDNDDATNSFGSDGRDNCFTKAYYEKSGSSSSICGFQVDVLGYAFGKTSLNSSASGEGGAYNIDPCTYGADGGSNPLQNS